MSDKVQVQTIELVRLTDDNDAAETVDAGARLRGAMMRWFPFLAIVVVPTLVVAVYMFGLAAPRFVSEIKYVARSPASGSASQLASLVQGSSITRATDDAFVAEEYMLSRDAMRELIDHDGLMQAFGRAPFDPLWRLPGLFSDPTNEELAKHYKQFVSIDYDHSTGISTLTVQAFRAEDAQRLAGALVGHTEAFLNSLNNRAQQDAIQSAVRDVDFAKAAAYKALDAVTAFRNAEETVDPTKASTAIVTSIGTLSVETATTNTRLAELITNTPQSPEIPTLRSRLNALQGQIVKQRQQLGGDSGSFAPQIAQYQRLLLDQNFAEKAFISALTSLETARLDSSRQRVFLERVTTPDLPDDPAYPYRGWTLMITVLVCLALWRVVSIMGKDTRNHVQR